MGLYCTSKSVSTESERKRSKSPVHYHVLWESGRSALVWCDCVLRIFHSLIALQGTLETVKCALREVGRGSLPDKCQSRTSPRAPDCDRIPCHLWLKYFGALCPGAPLIEPSQVRSLHAWYDWSTPRFVWHGNVGPIGPYITRAGILYCGFLRSSARDPTIKAVRGTVAIKDIFDIKNGLSSCWGGGGVRSPYGAIGSPYEWIRSPYGSFNCSIFRLGLGALHCQGFGVSLRI